jgi:ComF family protein
MVGNPLEQLFAGRYQAGAVTSFLFFTKSGMVQRSLHQLKYNGAKELGHYLGFNFGQELRTSYRFREVELVAPVPLHWEKLRLRGYNQSEWIAKGVGEAMGIQVVPNLLERVKATSTQTRKGRLERWENVAEAFAASKQLKTGARVLLVDDVLTTGATLEACARALDAVTGRPSYLATLACAVR